MWAVFKNQPWNMQILRTFSSVCLEVNLQSCKSPFSNKCMETIKTSIYWKSAWHFLCQNMLQLWTNCLPEDRFKANTCLALESMVTSSVSACNKIWLVQWREKIALIISDQIFMQALLANNSYLAQVIFSTWFPINFELMTDINQIWKMDRIKCQQMSWT